MPPVIAWALGAIGAIALAKVFAAAARKANAELEEIRAQNPAERPIEKLERDPVTGEYRPGKSEAHAPETR
jgi:hypothetical protein